MANKKTRKKIQVKASGGPAVGGLFRISHHHQQADLYEGIIFQCIEILHPYGERNPYGVLLVAVKFEKNKALHSDTPDFFKADYVKWLTSQEAEAAKIKFAAENFL